MLRRSGGSEIVSWNVAAAQFAEELDFGRGGQAAFWNDLDVRIGWIQEEVAGGFLYFQVGRPIAVCLANGTIS